MNGLKVQKKVRWLFLLLLVIGSFVFVTNNASLYEQTIVRVVKEEVIATDRVVDVHDNEDTIFTQHLEGVVQNGPYRDEPIELKNDYSASGAIDHRYREGTELFVTVRAQGDTLTGMITNVKRDHLLVAIGWIFIGVLLLVGKRQGFHSLVSFSLNALVLYFALDLYIAYERVSLLAVAFGMIFLFTFISLYFVSGWSPKTFAAVLSTLVGTLLSFLVMLVVMKVTNEQGLHYEEMQFLSRPYYVVFLAGVLIGSLGAVMDVSITMASSLFELHDQHPHLTDEQLRVSGKEIGQDIMGTITSILFFAYLSGSIPMLLIYMMNRVPLGYALPMNMSLELARALAGGIGVVLTIPISLFFTLLFIRRKKVVA